MGKSTTNIAHTSFQGELFSLSAIEGRKVEVSYTSPDISSYGGLLLLREVERRTSVIDSLCKCLSDTRHKGYITHTY